MRKLISHKGLINSPSPIQADVVTDSPTTSRQSNADSLKLEDKADAACERWCSEKNNFHH